eukprot:6492007-Amphidinium_carterae.1
MRSTHEEVDSAVNIAQVYRVCSQPTSHVVSITMAASTSAFATPVTPVPRPSTAPELDMENVEYSPISLPPAASPAASPVPVDSSSDGSTSDSSRVSEMPTGMTAEEAVSVLLSKQEVNANYTRAFWTKDPELEKIRTYCPSWVDLLHRHCLINVGSQIPSTMNPDGFLQRWIHTTEPTFKRMITTGNLGHRFIFSSASQAGLHRLTHHHYGLSAARLDEGCLVVGILIKELYVTDHATSATNGYLDSESLTSMPLEEAGISIFAMIHVASSLATELKTDSCLALTRASISHYESLYEVSVLSEHKLASSEMLVALATDRPHSTKVRATLQHQTPEFFDMLMQTIKVIKDAGAKEAAAEQAEEKKEEEKSKASNYTTFNVSLGPDDECTLTVKKMKVSK